jgi:taurine dioxygenase
MEAVPFSTAIGAEVRGVDLSRPATETLREQLTRSWHEHLVLVFRDQHLDNDALLRFGSMFGELDAAPNDKNVNNYIQGRRELLLISNVKEDGRPIGSLGSAEAAWHTDMSYDELPAKASALYAREIPESGGDTGFLNMYAAYETLPDALRLQVEDRSVKHDATHNSAGELRSGLQMPDDVTVSPGAVHPMVRTHPETGRKALFLGRRDYAWVVGLPVDESETLLDAVWAHCEGGDFSWRHRWRVGDLVLWDNRCAMHRRDAFDDSARRVMIRTQIKGDKPH